MEGQEGGINQIGGAKPQTLVWVAYVILGLRMWGFGSKVRESNMRSFPNAATRSASSCS